MVNESNIDAALTVQKELQSRMDQADQIRRQQVDRARYEVDLARRRYMQVDPEKRYVAEVLEAEWNEKLRLLEEAQTAYEKAHHRDQLMLNEDQKTSLRSLSKDFTLAWNNPGMHHRDRKRITRLLIEDVTLIKNDLLIVHIRFKGGAARTLHLSPAKPAWEIRQTDPEVISRIDQLLEEHTEAEIAPILNKQGLKSGAGLPFTRKIVSLIRYSNGLPTRRKRLRNRGFLTRNEITDIMSITMIQLDECRKRAWVKASSFDSKRYLYERPSEEAVIEIRKKIANLGKEKLYNTHEVQYET